MARASWLVDSSRIATKIRSASTASDEQQVNYKSNPTKACPNCRHIIDNSDVAQEWPGLPRGVKFDPSDQEIMWHLLAKVGVRNLEPHPFIDEFIPTVNEDDGICYTHPQNLPGVKQDGSVTHFFHRAIKAYNTGTRKRRKIHSDNFGDVRWHKTGRTKPVLLDGIQQGCKKIMVLYVGPAKGGKPEKTNWVMHQYHLGMEEEQREGEYVVSKVFYQQQQVKQSEKNDVELPEVVDAMIVKIDPVSPKSVTPEPPCTERVSIFGAGQESTAPSIQHHYVGSIDEELEALEEEPDCEDHITVDNPTDQVEDNNDKDVGEEAKGWDGESPFLIDSQQLAEGLSLCDELLQSQSPNRDGNRSQVNGKPCLSDYAHLGPEHLKKDLEACQELNVDLEGDFRLSQLVGSEGDFRLSQLVGSEGDFRLSQLEFGSQESYISFGGGKMSSEFGEPPN